jgi:hypothetical protein
MTAELVTIIEVARAILQLLLLCGGAIACAMLAVVVFHLLGWQRS